MTKGLKIVLLNGSPKGRGGTSGSFGDYILNKIPNEGISKETFHVGKTIRKEEKWNDLVLSVKNADTIILAFPLYWDSLPSHLIKGLEKLYAQKEELGKSQNFYTMVNNGFPEPWHNEIAIKICHRFADKMSFKWQGALNIGGGAAVAGRPLEDTGGMTMKLRQTLDIAAKAMGEGKPIPKEVSDRLSKPMYPAWINTVFGGMMWKKQAKKKGVQTSLKAKPYKR
jgi:hypothetical protein